MLAYTTLDIGVFFLLILTETFNHIFLFNLPYLFFPTFSEKSGIIFYLLLLFYLGTFLLIIYLEISLFMQKKVFRVIMGHLFRNLSFTQKPFLHFIINI